MVLLIRMLLIIEQLGCYCSVEFPSTIVKHVTLDRFDMSTAIFFNLSLWRYSFPQKDIMWVTHRSNIFLFFLYTSIELIS